MKTILIILITLLSVPLFANPHFSKQIEKKLDQIVSVFENSSTEIRYDYIENIDDGRGYTAGKVGFTTATSDLLAVVNEYLKNTKNRELEALVPLLQERAQSESDDTKGLEKLPFIWKQCSKDKKFRDVQDLIADQFYRAPARNYLSQYKLKTPMAYLFFYDSLVQHGDGGDPDSFTGIIKKMKSTSSNEVEFLTEFLRQREKILKNPTNLKTKEEWAESVDRVHALKRLLNSNNLNLSGTFEIEVWGSSFTIK